MPSWRYPVPTLPRCWLPSCSTLALCVPRLFAQFVTLPALPYLRFTLPVPQVAVTAPVAGLPSSLLQLRSRYTFYPSCVTPSSVAQFSCPVRARLRVPGLRAAFACARYVAHPTLHASHVWLVALALLPRFYHLAVYLLYCRRFRFPVGSLLVQLVTLPVPVLRSYLPHPTPRCRFSSTVTALHGLVTCTTAFQLPQFHTVCRSSQFGSTQFAFPVAQLLYPVTLPAFLYTAFCAFLYFVTRLVGLQFPPQFTATRPVPVLPRFTPRTLVAPRYARAFQVTRYLYPVPGSALQLPCTFTRTHLRRLPTRVWFWPRVTFTHARTCLTRVCLLRVRLDCLALCLPRVLAAQLRCPAALRSLAAFAWLAVTCLTPRCAFTCALPCLARPVRSAVARAPCARSVALPHLTAAVAFYPVTCLAQFVLFRFTRLPTVAAPSSVQVRLPQLIYVALPYVYFAFRLPVARCPLIHVLV